jgi:glycosyltransferase involved in cell wall biosynthesis
VLLALDEISFAIKCRFYLQPIMKHCSRVHSYSFWFSFLSVFSPSLRRKSVYTETGGDWIELSKGRGSILAKFRYLHLGRLVLNRINVLVETSLMKSALISCGVRGDRIHQFRFEPSSRDRFFPVTPKVTNPFTITYVGRLLPQKGVHTLLEAFDILVNQRNRDGLRLVLVGPDSGFGIKFASEYGRSLHAYVQSKRLESVVIFMGYVGLEELAELYSSSMVHVLPSMQDAFGWVAYEAMLCATASIVTSACGVAEVVDDGKTGYIVPPGNPQALADRLDKLIEDKERCIEMGLLARETVEARYRQMSPLTLFEALMSGSD